MSATVVSVEELIGTSGKQSLSDTSFSRVFLVKLSAASNVGQDIALTASHGGVSIPAIGAAWPRLVAGRATPTVKTKDARLHDRNSRLLWAVTVSYDNEAVTQEQSDAETAPWLRDPIYRSAPVNYDLALENDFSAIPKTVLNSAGDAFDPVPTYPHANRMLTITRARLQWSELNAQSLQNTINNAAFNVRGNSYAAGKLRLTNWSAQTALWTSDTGIETTYYEETIEIEVSTFDHGHTLKILDQGYRAKATSGDDPQRITDDFPGQDGAKVVEPVLLDGSGGKATSAVGQFLEFQQFRSANWAALGVL